MEYKKISKNDITLHLINSERFKSVNIVLFLTKEFNKKDITYGGCLASNLVYSSKKYDTKNKMAIKGEELFGAKVGASFGITGKCESFIFTLDMVNPKYTDLRYWDYSLDFLSEVILNPNIDEKGFNKEYFNIIKNDMITNIRNIKDNPNLYAGIEYAKIMYKNTPSEYSSYPDIDDLNDVTPESLYDFYKELFQGKYKIDIAVIGEIDESISDKIFERFSNIKGNNKKLSLKIKHKYDDKVITKIDSLPFNQSKLYVGYRLIDLDFHEINHVLKVYNTILGTMNDSILFNIVREEHSLCYTVGSYVSKYNPSLTIYAGINKVNYEKSLELIKECVNLISDKNAVSRLFDSAKKTINTYLNNYYDDVVSQVNTYYNREFEEVEDIETLREKIQEVTIDEVIKLNDKIKLSTIYLMKGDSNND